MRLIRNVNTMKTHNGRIIVCLLAILLSTVLFTSCHKWFPHNYEYGMSFEIDGVDFEVESTYNSTGLCIFDTMPRIVGTQMRLYWFLPSGSNPMSGVAYYRMNKGQYSSDVVKACCPARVELRFDAGKEFRKVRNAEVIIPSTGSLTLLGKFADLSEVDFSQSQEVENYAFKSDALVSCEVASFDAGYFKLESCDVDANGRGTYEGSFDLTFKVDLNGVQREVHLQNGHFYSRKKE